MRRRLLYELERFLLRGPLQQLLLIAAMILGIAVTGGLLAMIADPAFRASPGAAIWWSFLRLTDPGYLGDDQGAFKRVVSTVLTVFGLAIFVGLLIAIMTQWFRQTLERYQRGFTPVSMSGHVVVLGLTDRTVSILREIVRSEHRVKWMLTRLHRERLQIVILARRVDAEITRQLREDLEDLWGVHEIVLRSGEAWEPEDLERTDFLRASVVIIPGADFPAAGLGAVDTRTVTTLLAIARAADELGATPEDLPMVVAELHDSRKVSVARAAYPGHVEVLATDTTTSNLIAQNVRHTGLSHVYSELLSQRGAEIYLREVPELVGQPFHALAPAFPTALPVGLVWTERGRWRSALNPERGRLVRPDEFIAVIADEYEASAPTLGVPLPVPPPVSLLIEEVDPPLVRVLILGWSHKVPTLLAELDKFTSQRHEVTILTTVSIDERTFQLAGYDLELERVEVSHVEGDYNLMSTLRVARPGDFEHIVMIASDWLSNAESSDARTIVGHLMLRELFKGVEGPRPDVLVEINDASNERLFRERPGEVLVSSKVEGSMIAQVAMRPPLRAVFDALFGPGMPEIDFLPAIELGLDASPRTFEELRLISLSAGVLALGVRLGAGRSDRGGGVQLNPSRDAEFALTEKDDLIVLVY